MLARIPPPAQNPGAEPVLPAARRQIGSERVLVRQHLVVTVVAGSRKGGQGDELG